LDCPIDVVTFYNFLGIKNTFMNTYNTYSSKQLNHSLKTLSEVFENDSQYKALPKQSKEIFAKALLEACKIKPKND
jgi:hypothetical protein